MTKAWGLATLAWGRLDPAALRSLAPRRLPAGRERCSVHGESFLFRGRRPEKGFSGSTGGKRFFRGPRAESSFSPTCLTATSTSAHPPSPPFVCLHTIAFPSFLPSFYHSHPLLFHPSRFLPSQTNKINECPSGLARQPLPHHHSSLSIPSFHQPFILHASDTTAFINSSLSYCPA